MTAKVVNKKSYATHWIPFRVSGGIEKIDWNNFKLDIFEV
jgi:hypothetical protein